MHLLGGIALLIPPSITLILFGVIAEESIVSLFFAGVIPGIMLALSDAFIIVGSFTADETFTGKVRSQSSRTYVFGGLACSVDASGCSRGGCMGGVYSD